MKARTTTRGTHLVPSKSISSPSIPDTPQPQAAKAKEADQGQPPSVEQRFLLSESTDPAGRPVAVRARGRRPRSH